MAKYRNSVMQGQICLILNFCQVQIFSVYTCFSWISSRCDNTILTYYMFADSLSLSPIQYVYTGWDAVPSRPLPHCTMEPKSTLLILYHAKLQKSSVQLQFSDVFLKIYYL